jgi:hypothetical protein
VFVGEPIDFTVSATDPEGDAIAFSLSGAPGGASINPSSGLFSWRPKISDTGAKTIVLQASDGAQIATSNMQFTVIMPVLDATENIRFLRPAGGEVFTYGDTLTIAFATRWCAHNVFMQIFGPGQDLCSFANTSEYWPTRDSNDSTDVDGNVRKFSRRFQNLGMWIGYYKLPLVAIGAGSSSASCPIGFGGGTARVDSLRIKLKDPYANTTSPQECTSDPIAGFSILNDLLIGKVSNMFSVAPR